MTQDRIIRITQEKFQQALATLGPKALEIDIKFGLNLRVNSAVGILRWAVTPFNAAKTKQYV